MNLKLIVVLKEEIKEEDIMMKMMKICMDKEDKEFNVLTNEKIIYSKKNS